MAKLKRKYLIIHCTATPEGRDISPAQVFEWHTFPPPKGRGWSKVGYSKLVLLNGGIHTFVQDNEDQFVDTWEITNGVKGINSISMHVCYVGGVDEKFNPKDTRTNQQKTALEVIAGKVLLMNPEIKIAGHYHFAAKACPSFDVEKWLEEIGIPEKNIYREIK